ncbi:AtpZ/AtpI family protein [Kocuria rosea]|uniref:AtpZ/AtpI family protein n=1 Tax=Kocuria rosea TaxID=1275 RepID=A0A4R5YD31_KOCRO|nr:AtpZ/AtpI family protein [Kocuria rosea]TDL42056.1 AtpZ/AtpI family protein [Kocuria rosea]
MSADDRDDPARQDGTPPAEDGPGSPQDGPAERPGLRTAGELVEGGGLSGGLTTLLYVVIGMGFWSLVGWGADRVLGTRWIVVLGACIGAASGIYVVYLHMQEGLRRSPSSDGADPHNPHQSGPDSAPRP